MTFAAVERLWIRRSRLALLLLPASLLYCAIAELRRAAYRIGLLRRHRMPVPVIVVGNVTVGGTGKTPVVAWLAQFLKDHGYRPGLVARGYGGNARCWPQQVRGDSDPAVVGDEPVMLAGLTGCPMAAGPERAVAATQLLEHHDCDLILSDDGLQHYALGRDIEIVVVDGVRRFDTGFCLPAGPLRERSGRLRSADIVIVNGLAGQGQFPMRVVQTGVAALLEPEMLRPLDTFRNRRVHAVAGIGNPRRFFDGLRQARMEVLEHAFPDHHAFQPQELMFGDQLPVLMTEKDAVKCRRFATADMWVVRTRTELDDRVGAAVLELLERRRPLAHQSQARRMLGEGEVK